MKENKLKLTKGQYAFYSEPDSKIEVNIPCEILRVKRIYCTVRLFNNKKSLNGGEVWEVPIEDLVPSDSFYVEYGNSLIGYWLVSAKTNAPISPNELREEIKRR